MAKDQMPGWIVRIASSPRGTWFFLNVSPRIDRVLLRLTRGRFSSGLGQPILLLESTGARSGLPRSVPLLFTKDGDRFILIASKGGKPEHPAWYHNLRAKPEATVLAGGRRIPCTAHEAEGEERTRLWEIAATFNPGYNVYRERARARRIPVMVLTPSA